MPHRSRSKSKRRHGHHKSRSKGGKGGDKDKEPHPDEDFKFKDILEQANLKENDPKRPTKQRLVYLKGHSKKLVAYFRPIWFFLVLIGNMPYAISEAEKDGTYKFELHFFSLYPYIFLVIFVAFLAVYLHLVVGFLGVIFNIDGYEKPHIVKVEGIDIRWEEYALKNNMVIISVMLTYLTIGFCGIVTTILHGRNYSSYFNYWNQAIQVIDADVTRGVLFFIITELIFFVVGVSVIIVGYFLKDKGFKAIEESAQLLIHLTIRFYDGDVYKPSASGETTDEQNMYTIFGVVIMIFAFLTTRANMIQFLFFCRLLTNASYIWNERLIKCLYGLTKSDIPAENQNCRRAQNKPMMKDHLLICQLFLLTEHMFNTILLIFYLLQLFCLILQFYGVFSVNNAIYLIEPTESGKRFNTVLKVVFLAIFTTISVINYVETTVIGAAPSIEWRRGYDITRRHGLVACKSHAQRNFVHSLFLSYDHTLHITASGYFILDKGLFLTTVVTVIAYVVTFLQIRPDLIEQ